MRRLLLSIALCLILSACATTRSPEAVESLLAQTIERAERRQDQGLDAEAFILLNAISRVRQDYPGLQDLRDRISPDVHGVLDREFLGSNRPLRPRVRRSLWLRALLYAPDRVLDLLDVASLDAHLGFGVYANAHATRALQLGGGARTTAGIGLHDHRSLGTLVQAEAGLSVLGAGAQGYAGALAGTSGIVSGSEGLAGLHRPSSRLYQDFRDYWALGGAVTLGIIGVEVDVHPAQALDLILGVLTIDWLNDDFASTRGLSLDPVDRRLLRRLSAAERWSLKSGHNGAAE